MDGGNQRAVSYSHLPPGKYKFRVRACNSDGVWNADARLCGARRRGGRNLAAELHRRRRARARKNAEASALDELAQNVRAEVNRSYYDATNKTYGAAKEKRGGKIDARYGWHGLMAMAISTGVAPEAEVPAILENCIADMKAHYHGHHAAGHITHQLLYDVFSDHGMIEQAKRGKAQDVFFHGGISL